MKTSILVRALLAALSGAFAWQSLRLPSVAQPALPAAFTAIAVEQTRATGADLFATDPDMNIWHVWQNDKSGRWGGLERLDGLGKDVAVVARDDGNLEVFVVGSDDAIWRSVQQKSGWSGWQNLGGTAKHLAVARTKAGRFALFTIGADDAVWVSQRTGARGTWSRSQSLGGLAQQLSAAEADGGGFRVFAIGSDNAIWHRDSAKGDWQSLGGEGSALAVTRAADGKLDVFHVGSDAQIYRARQNGRAPSFAPWQALGGNGGHCAVSNAASKRVTLVTLAADGRSLGFISAPRSKAAAGSGWSEWRSEPGPFPSESRFAGNARVEIPDLHVSEVRSVELGLHFEAAAARVTITRFPPIVTKRFHTPFGDSVCTVTMIGGGTGSFDRAAGQIAIPVTLKFDQSLDVPGVQEDTTLQLELRSDRADGAPLDRSSGHVALAGGGEFEGKGAINPLKHKQCQMLIDGTVSPLP